VTTGLVLLAASAVVLLVGAELFAEHAAAVDRRLGVSALAVGVLLAGAEPEELITAVTAGVRNHAGIGVGDAIGANVTMLTLTLGLAGLVRPLPLRGRVRTYAVGAAITGAAAAVVLADGRTGRVEGGALLALYVVLVAAVWWSERTVPAIGDGGLARSLTLVCAPAGFGKTPLLADWSQQRTQRVGWLSLDAGDNDPVRFWRHVVAALDGVRPGIVERVSPLLGPPAPASFEGLVTTVVNELAADPDELLLVLDDYHPMVRGRAATLTHDYKRNETIDLFGAMDVATGEVLYDRRKGHATADVLRFFKLIDVHIPRPLEVHVVLDNLSAHKAPEVRDWLAHPRRALWHLHLTPTSSSWLNLIERWFKELTDRRLRHGVFTSVADLEHAIETWAEQGNDNPKPFTWNVPAADIIAKVKRARTALTRTKPAMDH
jgi:transposase